MNFHAKIRTFVDIVDIVWHREVVGRAFVIVIARSEDHDLDHFFVI